ncbi:hypothetical protein CYY_001619 [Polysphondylium violaceum]|uniref:Actin binding protein n=1 Tax=Polysphondylium violaceum TaxID=133409 RepID=A0A8J4Q2R4_9MYCE|nr:hypothetical protein CYY_001619 [Polysphondylium violaceum]
MKIKVELLNGNEHRRNQQCPSVSHIFDGETAVKDHIRVLCQHFKIPTEKATCYALQNPISLEYVEDSFLTPEKLIEAEKSFFILRMKPHAIADRVVDNLKQNAPNSPTIKDIIFNIRYQMKDVEYVEEFITKGGINQLLEVIIKSRGNTQSYALTALRCFMGFNSGLVEVTSRPELIDKLYGLVCVTGVLPSVCRQAIELLFVVCNFDGFHLVHRAAKNQATESGNPAYTNLISLLASGDMETQLNTLTLFNCLLDNAPNPRKGEKLLSRWKSLGITKILKSQEHVTHSDFRTQLARFQTNSGLGLDSERKRTLTRQMSMQELELQLLQYREQQPLISLLCSELKFLRNAIKSAIENGSYINYRAPTERYDEYRSKKTEMIGDSPMNLHFLKRNDKFTSAFRKSLYVRSPNTSVLFDPSTLEETYEDLGDALNDNGKSPSSKPSNDISNIGEVSPIIKHNPSQLNIPPINSKSDISIPQPEFNFKPDDINNNNNSNQSNNSKVKVQPTKPIISPSKRMKPLHWTRILNSTVTQQKTIWNSNLPEISFDEEQFVDLYSLYTEKIVSFNSGSPITGTLSAGMTPVKSSKPIQKVVGVLSQKRQNAISIMCGKLPSDESLVRAIRELDSNKLSLENVSSLYINLPTIEEMASIQELHSAEVMLDKPERWCLMIDGFPKIKPRLRCWEYRLKFEDQIRSLNESIDCVSVACKELRTSSSVSYLFAILLQLGNYLNGGHQYRGQCDGFTLDSFYKIIEAKDNTNSGSLLDFAIKTLNSQPIIKNNNIILELSHIPNASLINFVEVGTQLATLSNEYTEILSYVEEITTSTDSEDPFLVIIPKFMNDAYSTIKTSQTKYLETEKLLYETIEYFNPSSSSTLSSSSSNNINASSLSSLDQSNKFTSEKFFTLFSTIITICKKSPSKRLSQKGYGLKISNSDDPMAVIIEALKTGTSNDMVKRWPPA